MIRVHCPVCDRLIQGASTAEWPQFPFCSERCRLVDLGRWLGQQYRIGLGAEGEIPAPPEETEEVP
jgi:endogenous inhibitor of DNA gyrase (YacG/DUF329 family)